MCKEYCSCILALGFAQWVFFLWCLVKRLMEIMVSSLKLLNCAYFYSLERNKFALLFFIFIFIIFKILAMSWGFCHFFQGSNYFLMYHVRIQCYRMDGFRATLQLPMRQLLACGITAVMASVGALLLRFS